MSRTTTFGVAVVLATIAAMPLLAQTPHGQPDPALMAAHLTNGMIPEWLTKAADVMSEADDAFKPTPEARSLGQVLAHVANSDYAGMTEAKARTMVQLGSMPMPTLTVLLIRTHHSSLHYGNVITYLRLRGKVPPSPTSPISQEWSLCE